MEDDDLLLNWLIVQALTKRHSHELLELVYQLLLNDITDGRAD